LLFIVAMEAPVFRRSAVVVAAGGDSGFLLELFRESHANGPVSFLDVGGAGAGFSCAAGGAGGGGNLTGDIVPERPCSPVVESRESRGGSFGSTLGALAPSVDCQRQGHRGNSMHRSHMPGRPVNWCRGFLR
jgi:hypothetical protein